MRINLLQTGLTAGLLFVATSVCMAGPSFNSNRKELAEFSRRAGAALHEGLADVHSMLQYLEQVKPIDAGQSRSAALRSLDAALADFKKIMEPAPRQPLLIKPRTEQEKRAVDLLLQALNTRQIKFPETERDLAELAIRLVSDFRAALVAMERFDEKSTRAYAYFERLFREEGFLLNVGVFCSVIWEMQEAAVGNKAASNKRLQPSALGAGVKRRG